MDRKQLLARIDELEAEVASLKAELAAHGNCVRLDPAHWVVPPAAASAAYPAFNWHVGGSNWAGT